MLEEINDRHSHPCPSFVGWQIKYWRAQKGITQKQLSELSGVKYRHLQEIESGRVDIRLRTMGLISMSLHITPHLLLKPIKENQSKMCEQCRYMADD